MNKRGFRYLLVLVLLLLRLIITASASSVVTVAVSDGSVKPGDSVELVVFVSNNTGISGAGLTVEYDEAAMELAEIDVLASGYSVENVEGNCFSWLKGQNITEDFELVTLRFDVKDTADGEYQVTVKPTGNLSANLSNEEASAVPATFESGTVKVSKHIPAATLDKTNSKIIVNASDLSGLTENGEEIKVVTAFYDESNKMVFADLKVTVPADGLVVDLPDVEYRKIKVMFLNGYGVPLCEALEIK